MGKKLTSDQTFFLKAAKRLSVDDKALTFDNREVRKRLGYLDENNTDKLKEILAVESFLVSNNFIQSTDVPERFKISQKGNDYLEWRKKRLQRKINTGIIGILNHHYTKVILKALCYFVLFIIINQLAYYFYVKNDINSITEPLTPRLYSTSTKICNSIFVLLSVILIAKNIKRRFGAWDFTIIFIYLYFRSSYSNWFFWTFFQIDGFNFLYVDVIAVYYVCCFFLYITTATWIKKIIIKIKPLILRFTQAFGNTGVLTKENETEPIRKKDSYLTPDLPLKELAAELNKDLNEIDDLGRNKFAYQIADEISQLRPYRAFAIGINGPWGSGKTSLIDLIINKIEKDDYQNNIKIIEFFPWLSKDHESLISNFLLHLEKSFPNNKSLAANIKAYSKALARIEKRFFDTEFTALNEESTTDIRTRYDSIVTEISNQKKLIVIKIDDLDRLTKDEIIDTLRLIRIIANFPKTVYLVGYDKEYIDSAIREKLTNAKPEQYIHKVFNVEFKIPETIPSIIKERLQKNIETQVELLITKNKITTKQKELISLFFDSENYPDVSFLSKTNEIFFALQTIC